MGPIKNKLIILGSGGHAKVIIDMLIGSEVYEIEGLISKTASKMSIGSIPVIGDDSDLGQIYLHDIRHAFVAVGDNRKRGDLLDKVLEFGFDVISVISHFAYVAMTVQLGKGVAVMPGCVINADTIAGRGAIINTGTTVDHDCHLGENVHLAPGCNVAGNVKIGDGAFLGVGCKVISNVTIGEWCIIGAGATVIEDIPPYSLAVGTPAKVVRKTNEGE